MKETNRQTNKQVIMHVPPHTHTLQGQDIFVQVTKVLSNRWVFDIEATLPIRYEILLHIVEKVPELLWATVYLTH